MADPIAFFDPLDAHNERWEELRAHPDWHFWPPRSEAGEHGFATFDEIIADFERVVARHPQTTFIGAHVGCASEDLALVSGMLDRNPNLYVDISARIGELGRQPYTARAFFLEYADRILFGTDFGYDPAMYRVFYRFLETFDESFDYDRGEVPLQGRWQIHRHRLARRGAAEGLRGERPTHHPRPAGLTRSGPRSGRQVASAAAPVGSAGI